MRRPAHGAAIARARRARRICIGADAPNADRGEEKRRRRPRKGPVIALARESRRNADIV